MHIMSKCGEADNVLTYEHICDTNQDRLEIDPRYVTLGSKALVLHGEGDALEFYIADSDKQWINLLKGSSASGNANENDES